MLFRSLSSAFDEIATVRTTEKNTTLLSDVLQAEADKLADDKTPESAFSAPGILLLAPQGFAAKQTSLTGVAYRSSLRGVSVSAFSTAEEPNLVALNSIAIAGKGRGKAIGSVEQINELVRSELSSVGNVVAQAIRLNLKLQPGVKLVEVVGSHRLSLDSTTEVKAAEKEMDKRLSAALSIASDRGEDDDGIQIIIPAFYANDSHVILLDVVASGPGMVATLTAQFKDLVQLENKKIQVALSLQGEEQRQGKSEYGVLQNYLSQKFNERLDEVSVAIRSKDFNRAENILRAQLNLLNSIQRSSALSTSSGQTSSMIKFLDRSIAALKVPGIRNLQSVSEVFEYAALKRINGALI